MIMNRRLGRLIDRFGLLIVAILASVLAWWLFRVAGQHFFAAMTVIAVLLLCRGSRRSKPGDKKNESRVE